MSEREPISGSSTNYGATTAIPAVGFPSDTNQTDLNTLSEQIVENVKSINNGLRNLERKMRLIGGPNDNVQLREKIHECQQNVNVSVTSTISDIQRLGVVASRKDKPQRLQAERLTQVFKEALNRYSTVQKEVTEKMAANMPKQARVKNDPQALEQQSIAEDEEATLLANQQAQASLDQFETSMLLEKESYINQIGAEILDVNQIMADLADIVHSQGQTVDTVENYVEDTAVRVEAARQELAQAAEYKRRLRKKKIIIAIILSILAIILIAWIVKAFR